MDGKLVLGLINYLMLSFIFFLGLLSVFLNNQRKKTGFLFLMFLCTGLLSFLFFAGIPFILPAVIMIIFCFLLQLFVGNQEFFGLRAQHDLGPEGKKGKIFPDFIVNMIVSAVSCLYFGYLYISNTGKFYREIKYQPGFNTIQLPDLIEEIGSNYTPLIFILIIILICSVVWFILMIESRRKKN